MGKKKDKKSYSNTLNPALLPSGSLELIEDELAKPYRIRSSSATDEVILKNGNMRVPVSVTADLIGITPDAVQKRYIELLKQDYLVAPADRRLMLTAQLESILNRLQHMLNLGSMEHMGMALKTVDHLAKLHDLYKSEGTKEHDLVTEGQFRLLVMLIDLMAERIANAVKAALGNELEPQIIDAAISTGLGEVQELLSSSLDKKVQIE